MLAVGGAVDAQVSEVLSAYSFDEIRALPTEQVMAIQLLRAARQRSLNLLAAGAKTKLNIFDSGYRVIDGQISTLAPWNALIADHIESFMKIPISASNTGNEASIEPYTASLDIHRAYLKITFGTLAEEASKLCSASSDTEARNSSWQLLADKVFNWSTWIAAQLQVCPLKSKV